MKTFFNEAGILYVLPEIPRELEIYLMTSHTYIVQDAGRVTFVG